MTLFDFWINAQCVALWILAFRIARIYFRKMLRTWPWNVSYRYPQDIEEEDRMKRNYIIAFCLIFLILIWDKI